MATSEGHQVKWDTAVISNHLNFPSYEFKSLSITVSHVTDTLLFQSFVEKRRQRSELICVACDVCGLSGATLLLVELSRLFPLFFLFLCQGDVDCCCACWTWWCVSVYNAWSTSYAFASFLQKYTTHLSPEIRLAAYFEVQKFTVHRVLFHSKISENIWEKGGKLNSITQDCRQIIQRWLQYFWGIWIGFSFICVHH